MRYLFCSLASHGYLYSVIDIARQLQSLGHEVAVITGRDFTPLLTNLGIEHIPYGREQRSSFIRERWMDAREIVRQIRHTTFACTQFDADVIVATPLTIGPLIYAYKEDIPTATIGLSTYLWPVSTLHKQPLTKQEEHKLAFQKRLWNLFSQIGHHYDLPGNSIDYAALTGSLHLLRSVPLLQKGQCLPSSVQLIGGCLWEPDAPIDADLHNWLEQAKAANAPILYVRHVLGRNIPDYWPSLVEVAIKRNIWLVAAIDSTHNNIRNLPVNIFTRQFIPFSSVLPHVTAAICSGTSSTVLSSLAHGLPLLLFPLGGEHPHVAAMCDSTGVSISLPTYDVFNEHVIDVNVDANTIDKSIQNLLSAPHMFEAAMKVKHQLAEYAQGQKAGELLEQLGITTKSRLTYEPTL